ncbi:magnesium/cobalt transporter CorA [Ulvibacterium marinum]|uniref:magnesium/cobalt transporter CorA n=1 Tax=Ulvibacterium marinum TaxID=2419782 RepID=UPI0024945E62|nr:magnesium/cobalt transporter CorA [Ulvibacterium marinum]
MNRLRKKTGLAPGSVVFTGNRKVDKVLIHYLQYDGNSLLEKEIDSHSKNELKQSPVDKVDWYDVRGLHDTELVKFFGNNFDIHPLVLEGVVDIYQRPKFEEYDKGNFIALRALSFDKNRVEIIKEHVSIYFNEGFIITFQETESDLFEAVRKRITSSSGRIRQRGADYLAYALVDALVDYYYVVLEEIEEVIEGLEEKMLVELDIKDKTNIHQLKKELLIVRKSVAPLREAIARFSKTDSNVVQDNTQIFIRDLYEHTVQIMDTIDSSREILNGLQDLFISELSFKMNKVMQLLTLISVIFIPLTFLAGIYGMNFDNIPELHHKHGYHILLGVMLIIVVVLMFIFRRKKWL